MSSRLHVTVEERSSDPDRWHPGLRRKVKEWAEARVFWRRGAPSYPTREAAKLRPMPSAAIRAIRGEAA